jgi:hypothetical protein
MREYLSPQIIKSFNSALSKLTGYERRQFAAELCVTYFENSPRMIERRLKVSREMVKLGLAEKRTGIRCIENYNERGAKKKKFSTKI